MRRSCGNLGEVHLKRSVHDLHRSLSESCGDRGKILSRRSLHEDFADAMSQKCLYESSSGMLLAISSIKTCKVFSSSNRFFV